MRVIIYETTKRWRWWHETDICLGQLQGEPVEQEDVRFVALLNKYNLKGTFNLNSGLMENVFRMIAAHDDILPMTTIEIVEHLRSLR